MSINASQLAKHVNFKLKTKTVESDLGQQIARAVYYQISFDEAVIMEPQNRKMVQGTLMRYVAEDFKNYVDARARNDHKRFHHVYEWDQTGNSESRLFTLRIGEGSDSATARIQFLKSKTKNRDGHNFWNKAAVMESGTPVTIRPKGSNWLVFQIDGTTIFSKGPIEVPFPGGEAVVDSLGKSFKAYNSSGAPGKAMTDSKVIRRIFAGPRGKAPRFAGAVQTKAAAQRAAQSAVKRVATKR